MMSEFFDMLDGKGSETLTSIDVSVQSHLMSLAAEESRLNGGMRRFAAGAERTLREKIAPYKAAPYPPKGYGARFCRKGKKDD